MTLRRVKRPIKHRASGPGPPEWVIDDSAIIQRVLDGDDEAYGDLVHRHQAQVYRLCLAILADVQEAEDASQAAFIKAFRRLGQFRFQAAFSTWLTRIAINECKDRRRHLRRRPTQSLDALLESGTRLPDSLIQAPVLATAPDPLPLALLEQLSPNERELLGLLASDEDPSYQDLGRKLGLSVNSVKGRLKRMRQKIRRLWGAQEKP